MTGSPNNRELSVRAEARLATIITWVAALIAAVVGISAPVAYFWLSYDGEVKESAVAARLHAAFVTQAISVTKGDWRSEVLGLIDSDLAPSKLPEVRYIEDAQGRVVDRSGTEVQSPRLVQRAPVLGHEGTIGQVVIARSLRPVLTDTLLVAILSLTLGMAIYASLRLIPLRALRRALKALRDKEAEAREEAEEYLRIVFEHSIEGIVLFARSGSIISCNPAAAGMFGYQGEELAGMPLTRLFETPSGDPDSEPFAAQHYETVACRNDGAAFPVDVAISEARFGGHVRQIAIVRDITERKEAEARLSYLANFDSLTGLPNRSLFRDRLAQAMERARRHGKPMALMFLDLDRFKTINDSLGHDVGDQLLKVVAVRLSGCVRRTDSMIHLRSGSGEPTISRLGGDEFTIILEELMGSGSAAQVAQRVLDALTPACMVGDHEIYISTSIGITLFPKADTDLDGLVKQADVAMYRSKELGRNTYHFYTDDLDTLAAERISLEASLRHALARGEFDLHYQPKADFRSGRIVGAEALLRWKPSGKAAVGPDRFVPILEETGLIVAVGSWVVRRACEQLKAWQRQGLPPICLAVNLSALQLRQKDLAESLAAIFSETGIDPSSIELELTESMLMDDSAASLRILATLAAMGVSLAIDDFGTGHSSLSYLRRFNVDTLKIDRSFVSNIPTNPEDNAIASAIVALAGSLNLKVVAEGVENEAQAEFLRTLGCDEMQGYLLSRPLPADDFAAWLGARPA